MDLALEITGSTPLVPHNDQLADKENAFAKAIAELTSKRTKTPADHEEIAHLEFLGGLYYDKDIGIHVPTWCLIACMGQAATTYRLGKDLFKAIAPNADRMPLIYDGPRDPEKLWAKPEFRFRKSVVVQRNKVTRVRPIFRSWGLNADLTLADDVLSIDDFDRIAKLAGRSQGLLDARKLGYGRFTVKIHVGEPA